MDTVGRRAGCHHICLQHTCASGDEHYYIAHCCCHQLVRRIRVPLEGCHSVTPFLAQLPHMTGTRRGRERKVFFVRGADDTVSVS